MAKQQTVQRSVYAHNPEGGGQWLHKGDKVPDWADITNPKVFIDLDGGEGPTEADDPDFINLPENRKAKYDGLSVDELRALCADRGLDDGGKKAELVERLQGADAALS